MKNIILALFVLINFNVLFAQVGINEAAPNSALDIINPAATGNGIEVTHNNPANGSSGVWIKNGGVGYALNAQNLSSVNAASVIRIVQNGTTEGLRSEINGNGWGVYNSIYGTGGGIYNRLSNNGIASFSDIVTSGGTGYYADLNNQNGIGIYIKGVDDIFSPTMGGDVFAFISDVFTQTPTVGGVVSGSIFSGNQYGIGHGILVNHRGVSGISAEFNINDVNNTNTVVQAISLGQGSAIVGQNQNNSISGTIAVADFFYTGTDVDDHRGVSGDSQPTAGWGIGVFGRGGWYGVFSVGNSGSSGVKTFTIDHPEDPENKMLRHFSIESNEVLNIYRGVAIFDTNGSVTIHLPDYYHSINKNASYQLTPIGASMPNMFIKKEIENGEFIISGGIPNKKVSWTVTAERNDPYLQQKPENRRVIIEKIGSRKGKYLTPELYNQSEEKGMFYNKNKGIKPSVIKKQKINLKVKRPVELDSDKKE